MRVLLIKMSSLGDVVHALPAVTDAASHGVRFDWVVEEAFAGIPARHPAVEHVIPIAWRRWRRTLGASTGELSGFVRRLRETRYDAVLDAQGLIKSGIVTALARGGIRIGFDRRSAREGAAAFAYDRRCPVPRGQHAVDRLRTLFAAGLDYPVPDDSVPADFGIGSRSLRAQRSCLLFHGTTWPTKHWPEDFWIDLAQRLVAQGWRVEIPWGDDEERARAARIAAAVEGAVVLERQNLDALTDRIAAAGLVVGVDTGLSHLAGALGVPAVVVYGATSAARTGCRGARVLNLQSDFPCAPCLSPRCGYQGPPQRLDGTRGEDELIVPACYARAAPDRVWENVGRCLAGDPGSPKER